MIVTTALGSNAIGCIVATVEGPATITTHALAAGIVVRVFEGLDLTTNTPIPHSCEVATSGECTVKTSTCVAGDWFTSDAAGLAVKTETGFALGRILADPVDGLALCVVSPAFL